MYHSNFQLIPKHMIRVIIFKHTHAVSMLKEIIARLLTREFKDWWSNDMNCLSLSCLSEGVSRVVEWGRQVRPTINDKIIYWRAIGFQQHACDLETRVGQREIGRRLAECSFYCWKVYYCGGATLQLQEEYSRDNLIWEINRVQRLMGKQYFRAQKREPEFFVFLQPKEKGINHVFITSEVILESQSDKMKKCSVLHVLVTHM